MDIDTSPALPHQDPLSIFTMQGFGKKFRRPGTGDSSQALISKGGPGSSIEVYDSYRESLNSLIEMVDNVSLVHSDGGLMAHMLQDDTASLKLVHNFLRASDGDDDDGIPWMVDDDAGYNSSEPDVPSTSTPTATTRNGRGRSLPPCPSMASLRSEYSITSPPEISAFEQKRRRAAKLSNFFGVNHREIVDDILESVETGVAEERERGTLNQAQAEVRFLSSFTWDIY